MPNPFARTLSNSRNHIFSNNQVNRWQDNVFFRPSQPFEELTPSQDDDIQRCYIDIQEYIQLIPGRRTRAEFIYFVGNPVMAREFGILWYASAADAAAKRDEITSTIGLPDYKFYPENPLADPTKELEGAVDFITPTNPLHDELHPILVLLH